MAHNKVNSPEHLKNGEKWHKYAFFSLFLHILLIHDVKAAENIKFQFSGAI